MSPFSKLNFLIDKNKAMETDYKSFMTGKGDKSKNITVITKKLRHVLFYFTTFSSEHVRNY